MGPSAFLPSSCGEVSSLAIQAARDRTLPDGGGKFKCGGRREERSRGRWYDGHEATDEVDLERLAVALDVETDVRAGGAAETLGGALERPAARGLAVGGDDEVAGAQPSVDGGTAGQELTDRETSGREDRTDADARDLTPCL